VQHVLTAFEDKTTIEQVPESHSSWKQAAHKKPLSRLRVLIRALRASGKRREAFSESIREGNSKGFFVDPEAGQRGEMKSIHVPECNLLRDVDTRWDSVYYMIKRARILRPVSLFFFFLPILSSGTPQAIETFLGQSRNIDLDPEELRLSKLEWAILKDLEMILLVGSSLKVAILDFNFSLPLVSSPSSDGHGKGSHSCPLWCHTVAGAFHDQVGAAYGQV
jgi:hypothetical protein